MNFLYVFKKKNTMMKGGKKEKKNFEQNLRELLCVKLVLAGGVTDAPGEEQSCFLKG